MKKKLFKIFIIELILVSIIFSILYFSKKSFTISLPKILSSDLNVLNSRSSLEEDIEEGLLNGNEIINLKDKILFKSPDEIFKVINHIVKDNAEIMYYTGVKYYNGTLRVEYSRPKEVLWDNQDKLRIKRDSIILNIIKDSMTDYEKLKAVHDYIVNTSRYDMDLFTKGKVEEESYTAYGVLINGVGVCEGYAKAMKYLLDEAGVENIVVIGESRNQGHAWNLVKLDGEYYHIDATWNDPITDRGDDILQYNYFNLNDDEISKTHTWERQEYPVAEGEYYNYFKYNDLIIYDEITLTNKLKESLMNREYSIVFKYENPPKKDFSINTMIEDIAYKYPERIGLQSYTYSIDAEHGIFNLQFNYH